MRFYICLIDSDHERIFHGNKVLRVTQAKKEEVSARLSGCITSSLYPLSLYLVLSLTQLQQNTAGGFGMDESDFRAACAVARFFIDQADAFGFEFGKRRFQIIHA